MTTLALLLGCIQTPGQKDSLDTLDPTSEGVIVVSPTTLEFGEVTVGASSSQVVTVSNAGAGVLALGAVSAVEGASEFTVLVPTDGLLDPGESTSVTVSFVPSRDGAATGRIVLNSDDVATPVTYVDVAGTGLAGHLAVSADLPDLGTVQIGCLASAAVTITNDGNAELVVSGADLGGTSPEFSIDFRGTPLPWTIAPGASHTAWVDYSPLDDTPDEATLRIESSSPAVEAAEVTITGNGRPYGEGVDRLTQVGSEVIDVVVTSMTYYVDPDTIYGELVALDELLGDSRRDYQLGLVDNLSCVDASDPFVDGTMSTSDREELLAEMVDGWATAYDVPTFQSVLNIFDEDALGAGGCNEGLVRDGSMLLILVVTTQDDYTPATTVEDFAEELQDLAFTPEMARLDVVGPDGSSGSCASTLNRWSAAAADLGGDTWSYCHHAWEDHYQAILADLPEEQGAVRLSQAPVEGSIEVWVDEVHQSAGWYYTAADNTVYFEFDAVPAAGSRIEVRYAISGACPS